MNRSKPPIDGRRSLRTNQLAAPQVKSSNIRHDLGEVIRHGHDQDHTRTDEPSGTLYVNPGRQHKKEHKRNGGDDGNGRHEEVEEVIGLERQRVEEGTSRLREAYERGNVEYTTPLGSLRKNAGISVDSVRSERGSLRKDTASGAREEAHVRQVGRAGSELRKPGRSESAMNRAVSMNADLNTGRAVEFHLGRLTPRDPRSRIASDTNITRAYTERVAPDNYCSSCGEEDEDLNESLLTTTTTNSSDQTATYSTASDSIAQESWENDTREDGSLLYISCYYTEKSDCETYEGNEILNRIQQQQYETQKSRSVLVPPILKPIENNQRENRIIKLIRKKSMSKKSSASPKGKKLNIEIPSATARKLKSSYIPYGEPREVAFPMSHNLNLGRRATLCEIKLGLQLDDTGDQLRVCDIIPDSSVYHSKQVEVNDLLLSVNDRPVTKQNLAEVLGQIHNSGQVKLTVQATKNKHELVRDKQNYKTKLVAEILNGVESDRTDMCCVYVNSEGVLYKYPADNNNLTNSFGLFLTLNNLFSNAPEYCGTSSVECDSYVIFSRDKRFKNTTSGNLLLMSFPHQHFNSYDHCLKVNKVIVSCLRFMFGYDLDAVFASNNFASLNRLFSFLFNRLFMTRGETPGQSNALGSATGDSVTNEEYIKICKVETYTPLQDGQESRSNTLPNKNDVSRSLPNVSRSANTNTDGNDRGHTNTSESQPEFETCLSDDCFTFAFPRKLKAGAELDAQINDALGELEANDTYEDGPKNFIVIGTCLYYKTFLVSSHINEKDLQYIHAALYCNGILHLNSRERYVKNLIMWKRVYPKSHTIDNLYYNNSLKACNTYYLLVYGRSNFALCTLLESNYFTNPNINRENATPDVKLTRHAEEIVNFLISTRNVSCLNREIALLSVNAESNPTVTDWADSVSGSYRSQSTLTDEEYYRKPREGSLPIRIVAGAVLYFYVHVVTRDRVMVTPDRPHRDDAVFNKFQTSVYKIEKVFRNYAKFKRSNSALNSKPVKLNRSLICVKEAGIRFEVEGVAYWTLGRLYNNVSQVYVCYVDEGGTVMSQNMIEIMFKLFLSFS